MARGSCPAAVMQLGLGRLPGCLSANQAATARDRAHLTKVQNVGVTYPISIFEPPTALSALGLFLPLDTSNSTMAMDCHAGDEAIEMATQRMDHDGHRFSVRTYLAE